MPDSSGVPLIIADGDTPTAQLAAAELEAAFGRVEMRPAQRLYGAELADRPLLVVRLCHPELAWLPDHLASRGLRTVVLYTGADNTAALTTYSRQGFVRAAADVMLGSDTGSSSPGVTMGA